MVAKVIGIKRERDSVTLSIKSVSEERRRDATAADGVLSRHDCGPDAITAGVPSTKARDGPGDSSLVGARGEDLGPHHSDRQAAEEEGLDDEQLTLEVTALEAQGRLAEAKEKATQLLQRQSNSRNKNG